MNYGVIDVGSNSVRLMISSGGNIFKLTKITKLAEGVVKTGVLSDRAIERTAFAVKEFVDRAKSENADEIYIFATAGVRQAKNGIKFCDTVKNLTGISVDVVSGEQEAMLGAYGAVRGDFGGIIDIGGASTEITYLQNGQIAYSKSVDMGAVRLFETFSDDKNRLYAYIDKKIEDYGKIIKGEYFGIGGTILSVASMLQKLCPYDPLKVDGYKIKYHKVKRLSKKLLNISVQERKNIKGLQPERAEIIASGVSVLFRIMKKFGLKKVVASESDNLEGYLKLKTEKK